MGLVRPLIRPLIRTLARDVQGGIAASLLSEARDYLNGIAPYHWFDFINDRCLYASNDVGGVSGATGYSFARASTGYYTNADGTLTSFASGALRRGTRGVLIEGARTNLLLRSQEFDNASWTKLNNTITANDATAPDGTATADRLTISGTGGGNANQSIATTATTYTASVFLKQGNTAYSEFALIDQGAAAHRVRLTYATGAVSVVGGTPTATVTALANGWYFCTLTVAIPAIGAADTFAVYPLAPSSSANGDFCYAWQADVQAGGFASSPIVTTTASATRAADVLTCTAGVSYPLSLWAEFERAVDTGAVEYLFAADSGTINDQTALYLNGTDVFRVFVNNGGAAQADVVAGSATVLGTAYKGAARAETNNVNAARSGTAGTADVAATMPAAPSLLRFGAPASSGLAFFGYIRRAAIFNSALSDANLQTVTT